MAESAYTEIKKGNKGRGGKKAADLAAASAATPIFLRVRSYSSSGGGVILLCSTFCLSLLLYLSPFSLFFKRKLTRWSIAVIGRILPLLVG